MIPARILLLFFSLLLILMSGCSSLPDLPAPAKPSEPEKPQEQAPDEDAIQAQSLYNGKSFGLAAPLLEALGSRPLPEGWKWQLKAADAWLQYGNIDHARVIFTHIPDTPVDADHDLLKKLVRSQFMLMDARPEEVVKVLSPLSVEGRDELLQQRHYQLLAEGWRLSGNLMEAARTLEKLDLLLEAEPEFRLDNQLAIIRTLATMTNTALTVLQPNPPGIHGGWMELARLIKLYGRTPSHFQNYLAQWKQQFPVHPAMPELLDGYFSKLGTLYQQAQHIAVLLPESGRYQDHANAIRIGILAAWYNEPEATRPTLHFYDTSNPDQIWPLYANATSQGAEFIIGPLQKSAVNQLIHAGDLDVPVLALNQVNTDIVPPENFYQFSLSPEDEARQVAEHAWLDGHRHPVILVPTSSWGQRILDAFKTRWEALGGEIAESQMYDQKSSDFGRPIQALLDIDQSKKRRKQIQGIIGQKVEYEPRIRDDADFIFLAAQPQKAREIRPQLQFHHALSLPIYSTSHAWSGYVDIQADKDIDAIRFPDIPWLLANEGDEPLSINSLGKLPNIDKRLNRFVAMGIDSYRLPGHLARLQTSENEMLDGKTGQIYLDELNRLHRQLIWAEIKNGQPKVTGYSPRITQDYLEKQVRNSTAPESPTDEASINANTLSAPAIK